MCNFDRGDLDYSEKVLHSEGGQTLEQPPQGSGHSTNLAEFKKC